MRRFKRAVILTKDNLDRRNLNGSKLCCFCSKLETIQHPLLRVLYVKALWRDVHFILGIKPPHNINHLFNSWSKQGSQNLSSLLLTRDATVNLLGNLA
jgi:hypothetical protein